MTDIQGSTRLWEEFPDQMALAVRRHEDILLTAITANQGRLIKSKGEGDSIFAVFETAGAAVRAAAEAQLALSSGDWSEGLDIKVRMAAHCGEAEMRDSDYFGPTINRCARIREVGHGGQILTSAAVRDSAESIETLRWTDHGVHRLRDLLRPERLWQVQSERSQGSFPKLKSLSVLQNNLPVQLTSFIGRKVDLERVKLLMRQSRLVTVVGFGGEGKTRLVLQLGADVDAESTTSIWFVALESLRTRKEVSTAIITVLGGDAESEATPETVKRIAPQAGLTWLILDNAEHLLAIVRPVIDLLLSELPWLRILVSSREPLHQRGEAIFRIPSLSVPPEEDGSIEALESSESGQLFLARALSRTSDFRLNAAGAKAIGAICRILNGVPLAIEQAAPLVAIMAPTQILERLETRIGWLASEDSSAPARHQSLTATIQWSYELLAPDERNLFLMLSLFRHSFTIEAATFLAQQHVKSETEATELLRGLVDKSMVKTLFDEDHEVRFRLLESLRQFAQPLVLDNFHPWMSRYVDWYVEFARRADSELYGPEQIRWLATCQSEQANFGKALEWCRERQDMRLLALAHGLRKFWMRRAMFSEGRRWLGEAYSIADAGSSPSRATLANVLGAFAAQQSDFTAALDYYRQALRLMEDGNETSELGRVYTNLGIALSGTRNLEEADEYYRRAIEVSRRESDAQTLSLALLNFSINERELGRFEIAELAAYEALALAEAGQDRGRIAIVQGSLCDIAAEQGKFQEAARSALESLSIWSAQPSPFHLGDLLLKVSRLALAIDEVECAVRLVGGAETLLKAAGAERDPDSLEIMQRILKRANIVCPPSSVHRWLRAGRQLSEDQLIVLATESCKQVLAGVAQESPGD